MPTSTHLRTCAALIIAVLEGCSTAADPSIVDAGAIATVTSDAGTAEPIDAGIAPGADAGAEDDAGTPPPIDAGATPEADAGTTAATDAGTASPVDAGYVDAGCLGDELLTALGKTHLLVGGQMADATAAKAPFDVRYLYLAGGIPDGAGPCSSCASATCKAGGALCDGAHGCNWWGCWQWDQDPPGQYAIDFRTRAKARQQIPWFTYYQLLQASGVDEGAAQVEQAATDAAFMSRYFNDFRFFLQQIGQEQAFVHIEPDFWGYAEGVNADPEQIPAKVAAANATDCAAMPNTIAGFGKCLVAMTRRYAPNARVGLHGSSWATGIDVTHNTDASLDVAGEAGKLAAFLKKAGGAEADFVAVDASDRDAGFYERNGRNTWWDATNATLPNFHQAFAWTRALAQGVGRPVIFWQVPLGNAAQNNTNKHWKDNRVDYFFSHTGELADAHVAGILFGDGEDRQTTTETDGNNFVDRSKAYFTAGGQAYCH